MREEQQVVVHAVVEGSERHVEAVVGHGEHPRRAALRAAARELGVPVHVVSLRDVTSAVDDVPNGVRRHVLHVRYDVRARPGTAPVAQLPAPTAPTAPGDGPPRVQRAGAYAVLTHEGRILLTRLRHAQVWTLPGGGIDHGESPLDAVRREVHEETGLTLTEARLLDVDSVHFTGHAPDGTLEDFHAVRVLYTGTVPLDVAPRVVELDGSSDAAAWRPIDQLDERERRRLAVALAHVP